MPVFELWCSCIGHAGRSGLPGWTTVLGQHEFPDVEGFDEQAYRASELSTGHACEACANSYRAAKSDGETVPESLEDW